MIDISIIFRHILLCEKNYLAILSAWSSGKQISRALNSVKWPLHLQISVPHVLLAYELTTLMDDAHLTGGQTNCSIEDMVGGLKIEWQLTWYCQLIMREQLSCCLKHGLSNAMANMRDIWLKFAREYCISFKNNSCWAPYGAIIFLPGGPVGQNSFSGLMGDQFFTGGGGIFE